MIYTVPGALLLYSLFIFFSAAITSGIVVHSAVPTFTLE